MSDGARAEACSRGGRGRGRIPAEGAGASEGWLSVGEEGNGWGMEQWDIFRMQDGAGEADKVGDSREESGVTGCSVEQERVLILNLALEGTKAESMVLFRGRDGHSLGEERAKSRRGHGEWGEEVARGPGSERLSEQTFKRLAEEDEAVVGVLGAGTWFGFDGQLEGGAKQLEGRGGMAKQGDIAGQAGAVGEKMTKGDLARPAALRGVVAGRAPDDKTGQQVAESCFEIEPALLVEEHGDGGGGDDLGEAGDVIEGFCEDGWRAVVVGEAAESG